MAKLTIEKATSLPADEVKKRLQALSERLAAKYGIDSQWISDTEASVKGKGASGKILCRDGLVQVLLDLSMLLSPMKGKIEERIRRELETSLA